MFAACTCEGNDANGKRTTFSFDPVGRVSRLHHEGLIYTDFTYNPASQIRTRLLSSDSWAWDGDVNVSRPYTVNDLNQYIRAGTVDFTYDLNGNLNNDETDSYAYDPENRLKWSGQSAGTVFFHYDGRGRLRRRRDGGLPTADYLYAGDAMIAEMTSSGAVLRRYIHGPGVDDPLIWYEGAGTADRRYLHSDERGSITTVTSNTGAIIARNTYDEWGVPAAANIGRFQYTGQQWLPEIGLYYYKARMYNPALGRFMQTDPIGYEDGMNLYAYVGNDPVNGVDPTGLYECEGTSDQCQQVDRFAAQLRRAQRNAQETGTRLPSLGRMLSQVNSVLASSTTTINVGDVAGAYGAVSGLGNNIAITLDLGAIEASGGRRTGAGVLAHEGTHAYQRREFGPEQSYRDVYNRERSAFQVESRVNQVLGQRTSLWFPGITGEERTRRTRHRAWRSCELARSYARDRDQNPFPGDICPRPGE